MKRFYYEVGEVFRKGRTRYVVKEAPHGTCKGCDFYRLKPNGAPECIGMDYACDRDYRDDEKECCFCRTRKCYEGLTYISIR